MQNIIEMDEIKYRSTPEMIVEINVHLDFLIENGYFDLLDAVLLTFRPEECDGKINFCIFMRLLAHKAKLPSFEIFCKRTEQALKNQNEMAMVAAINNVSTKGKGRNGPI